MKKFLKVIAVFLAVVCASACLASCKHVTNAGAKTLTDCAVSHEEKFGGVYILITIDDFNAMGYAFGDSLKITFSSGYVLDDLPYYNGYYSDTGAPLLVGYPGYPYIRAGFNNGGDMWLAAGLTDGDTATVELVKHGKYLDVQMARDIHYSDEQGDKSDEEFANFRAVNVGELKENVLYRSASPCDNQHKRAAVVDRLIAAAGVGFIINLADDEEELAAHIAKDDFDSPYFLSLYENDKVVPLSMNMAYQGEDFSAKLVEGLSSVLTTGLLMAASSDGPYLVHCVEGKDRTGFVCAVIEALAGATYQELVDDYMITYYNYYGINEQTDKARYDVIKLKTIDEMLQYVVGENVDITTADYAECAKNYLIRLGMSEQDVAAVTYKFTGK